MSKLPPFLLIHHNNTYYPVEIKATEYPIQAMLKNFSMLESLKINVGPGALICLTDQSCWLTETVLAHSIWEI